MCNKTTTAETNPGVASRLFWEEKASEYTLPFEEKTLARTTRTINLVERKGLSIEGARILDVGSGPGTFALPLALRGASVTALDISDNMLKQLIAEAHRLDISGIETIRTSWKEIDPIPAALSGKFDIVLTALSQAIETEKDILKMEQCSKQWCVYIATGKVRRQVLCERTRRMFGLALNPRPDIRAIRKKLEQMGRAFSYESYPIFVEEKKTIRQLTEDVARSLEAQGKRPDRQQIMTTISSLLKDLRQDGVVECKRHSDAGVLIWRVDGK